MLRAEERFLSDSPLLVRKATVQLSVEGAACDSGANEEGSPPRPRSCSRFFDVKREFQGSRWAWTVHVWVLMTSFKYYILPSVLKFSIRLWNVVKPLIIRYCLTFLMHCWSICKKKKLGWL